MAMFLVDVCSNTPCQNEGSCTEINGVSNCACVTGYIGNVCEKSKNTYVYRCVTYVLKIEEKHILSNKKTGNLKRYFTVYLALYLIFPGRYLLMDKKKIRKKNHLHTILSVHSD